MRKPFIYAISGYKNSGKTTLITKLVPLLTEKGYKVAVIKHDGHDFSGDVPGTDTFRQHQAGAYGTAVYSSRHFMVNKKCASVTEKELIPLFPEADIILIEGLKHSDYPKYICDYPNKIVNPQEIELLADKIAAYTRGVSGDGSL